MALAETGPNANLVLAHRYLDDPEIVTRRVDRAMALSGKAGSVQMLRATDDIPEMVHALDVLLTSEKLGRHIGPLILAGFRHRLTDELQVLAEERTYQRARRIMQMRKDLVSEPWGASQKLTGRPLLAEALQSRQFGYNFYRCPNTVACERLQQTLAASSGPLFSRRSHVGEEIKANA